MTTRAHILNNMPKHLIKAIYRANLESILNKRNCVIADNDMFYDMVYNLLKKKKKTNNEILGAFITMGFHYCCDKFVKLHGITVINYIKIITTATKTNFMNYLYLFNKILFYNNFKQTDIDIIFKKIIMTKKYAFAEMILILGFRPSMQEKFMYNCPDNYKHIIQKYIKHTDTTKYSATDITPNIFELRRYEIIDTMSTHVLEELYNNKIWTVLVSDIDYVYKKCLHNVANLLIDLNYCPTKKNICYLFGHARHSSANLAQRYKRKRKWLGIKFMPYQHHKQPINHESETYNLLNRLSDEYVKKNLQNSALLWKYLISNKYVKLMTYLNDIGYTASGNFWKKMQNTRIFISFIENDSVDNLKLLVKCKVIKYSHMYQKEISWILSVAMILNLQNIINYVVNELKIIPVFPTRWNFQCITQRKKIDYGKIVENYKKFDTNLFLQDMIIIQYISHEKLVEHYDYLFKNVKPIDVIIDNFDKNFKTSKKLDYLISKCKIINGSFLQKLTSSYKWFYYSPKSAQINVEIFDFFMKKTNFYFKNDTWLYSKKEYEINHGSTEARLQCAKKFGVYFTEETFDIIKKIPDNTNNIAYNRRHVTCVLDVYIVAKLLKRTIKKNKLKQNLAEKLINFAYEKKHIAIFDVLLEGNFIKFDKNKFIDNFKIADSTDLEKTLDIYKKYNVDITDQTIHILQNPLLDVSYELATMLGTRMYVKKYENIIDKNKLYSLKNINTMISVGTSCLAIRIAAIANVKLTPYSIELLLKTNSKENKFNLKKIKNSNIVGIKRDHYELIKNITYRVYNYRTNNHVQHEKIFRFSKDKIIDEYVPSTEELVDNENELMARGIGMMHEGVPILGRNVQDDVDAAIGEAERELDEVDEAIKDAKK